eukprot:TRINITY_DN32954_c0_g1_i1.p1 TRINITY_DN32954_c0_g1~~TRINITY_DN32954_c0_g1_i1.p1  ORF type:complete len:520 (+),score=195.52 TRINITY_DN32954_c0_g1_i1:93-1562(+)
MNAFMCFLIFIASVGGALFGYDTGVVSGAMIQIKSDSRVYPDVDGMNLNNIWQEIVVSATTAGAAIGCVLCGRLNQTLGRRKVNLTAAALFVISCAMMAAAPSIALLVVGRTLVGVAIGFAATTVPMYIAEMSEPDDRGRLITINNVSIVGGQVIAALVACSFDVAKTPHGWRYMLAIGGAPGVVMFVGFLFLPESPRWLVSRGRIEEARTCLAKIRHGDFTRELQEMVDTIEEEESSFGFSELMKDKPVLRALTMGAFLQVMQQLAGINTLMYYSATILQNSGGNDDLSPFDHKNIVATCLSSAVAFAQMVGNVIGMFLIDRVGRRSLALFSLGGCVVTLGALGGIFVMSPSEALAAGSMCAYLVVFGMGMAPIPWVFNAEVYPLYARSFCIAFTTFVNWVSSFAVSMTFLTVAEALSTNRDKPKDHPDGVFWMLSFFCVLGFVVLHRYMPETQGLALEDVTDLFRRDEDYDAIPERKDLVTNSDARV